MADKMNSAQSTEAFIAEHRLNGVSLDEITSAAIAGSRLDVLNALAGSGVDYARALGYSDEYSYSDWEQAFGYAGEEGTEAGDFDPKWIEAVPPGSNVPVNKFSRKCIDSIIGIAEGKRDERNWVIAGKLKDGRYFCLSSGCDYTGWG